ncbi:MAG TPA: PKD domain-containing protein [Thermoanaerobaculia bacterium]|nr:PKD domain-containing protein [Thermoanaerobaculia bacterium]
MKLSRCFALVAAMLFLALPLAAETFGARADAAMGPNASIGGGALKAVQCCYDPEPPFATFTYAKTGFVTYSLNASGSYDVDGSIVSYHWDFGDGETATTSSSTISHSFGADIYTVTLTVTDNDNLCDVYSRSVKTCGGSGQPQCPY